MFHLSDFFVSASVSVCTRVSLLIVVTVCLPGFQCCSDFLSVSLSDFFIFGCAFIDGPHRQQCSLHLVADSNLVVWLFVGSYIVSRVDWALFPQFA